ncbi:hypothetical protein L218DRAFT_252147 [Marasmius fiardii PR-910]|nr:hypothetical protein L218DRAFT_252147 [Marasmius fiardii PR-910]
MHFPLLSRLSHLIHRRPKSESFAADVLKQLAEELADEDESKPLPHSRSLDSNDGRSPFILPPHLVGVLPQHPIPTSFNDILIVLSNLERRIPLLEDENARLKQEKDKLIFKNQLCEQDINLHKTQAVRQQSYLCKLQHEFQQMQLQQEQKRLEHIPLEDFLIKTLASYPPGHVFRKIAIAIDAGSSFASAIVAVMREEVETSPNSPWSKLVPAIVGPRTSDQYASALSIVLKARKDLRHSQNASRFWKQQAKLEDANADVITPSSSILSDVQESLSEERQRAVNDLLRKLRSGEIPIRSRVVTQAAPAQKSREEASSSSLSSPPQNIESLAAVPDAAPGPPLQDVFEAAPTPLGSAMNTIPDPSSTQDEHRNLFTTLNSIPVSHILRCLMRLSLRIVSSSPLLFVLSVLRPVYRLFLPPLFHLLLPPNSLNFGRLSRRHRCLRNLHHLFSKRLRGIQKTSVPSLSLLLDLPDQVHVLVHSVVSRRSTRWMSLALGPLPPITSPRCHPVRLTRHR